MRPQLGDDRTLQDHVIRYLTDAEVRSRSKDVEFLDSGEAERAQRFSRFLARRYYRDRLQRGFRYSGSLASPSDAAERVVDSSEFDSILVTCALGSIATAKQVGDLARERLLPLRSEEWWNELLDYDYAFFIQLAAYERASTGSLPTKSATAIMRSFRFSIPELVTQLKVGEGFTTSLSSPTTLLFSRTQRGRIYVVELDRNAQKVFSAIIEASTVAEIAVRCSASANEIRRILNTLETIGAVVMPD